ncbi:MAG: Ca-activated chloride channel family protein, partial [Myxococcota bacterium]
FVLRYALRGEAVSTGLLLFPGDKDGEKFFLTMVQPPKRVDDVAMPPREYVFIVDVSGSMHGFPLDTAKSLMRDLFVGLRSQDRFNVMMFSGGSRMLSEQSVPATQANLEQALSVLGGQRGGGGTRILPALKRALAMPAAGNLSRSFIVVTDGYVSVEPSVFELIRSSLDDANLFSFGIGKSVNRHLVEGMARVGMGEPFVALDATEARKVAKRFRTYIASPALTNISVDFKGFDAYDVEPSAIPDLFAERPIVVFGKYRGSARGKVVVSGTNGQGRWSKTIDVASAKEDRGNEALRYLWARHRIANLADLNRMRHNDKRKEQVTELGLKYHLMTAYTSFIAVDPRVRNKTGSTTSVKQPLPLPSGVSQKALGLSLGSGSMGLRGVGTGGGGASYGMGGMGRKSGKRYRAYKPRPVRTRRPSPEAPSPPPASAEKTVDGDDNQPVADPTDGTAALTGLSGLTIAGTLAPAKVKAMLPRLKALLQACLKAGDRLRVSLVIGADGRVVMLRSTGGGSGPARCLKASRHKLGFAASTGTTMVTFTLTR